MNPETLQAIKDSRDHWRRMRDGNENKGESIGTGDCALCKRFFKGFGSVNNCVRREPPEFIEEKCPVFEKTGQPYCRNTPYYETQELFDTRNDSESNRLKWQEAAQNEVEFLESLLPNELKD